MLSSISLKHFKSFEDVSLRGFKQINIIVGQSAAGKTTLLEGLRIAISGQPQALWNLLAQRGNLMFIPPVASREQSESLWGQYFYNFNTKIPISFILSNDDGISGEAVVRLDSEGQTSPRQEAPGMPPVVSGTSVLTIDRKTFLGEASTLRMNVNAQGGVQFDQGPEIVSSSEFFSANQVTNSQQAATWFSALSINNRERSIVNTMRKIFPSIEDLSVQAPNGLSSLHATVRHMSRKIPINSVSGGITKFVSVLLAIQQYKDGVVMIDELENGIYYELFEPFWRAICETAKDNGTQLFVTTHSLECLKGASAVLNAHPELFSLIQVYQVDGQSRASVSSGKDANAAIETGIEIRS